MEKIYYHNETKARMKLKPTWLGTLIFSLNRTSFTDPSQGGATQQQPTTTLSKLESHKAAHLGQLSSFFTLRIFQPVTD